MQPEAFFNDSPFCLDFAKSVGVGTDPQLAIAHLADGLRKSNKFRIENLSYLYESRNIRNVSLLAGGDFDGKLEPLGQDYMSGFEMSLNRKLAPARFVFTVLHELMHTFFYQYLPGRKFKNHFTDLGEERLCNFGAAHFLMPKGELCRALKAQPVCLETAQALCHRFCVSLPTLILRLRHLKLWDVQLSTWIHLSNGRLVLEKSIGGLGTGWTWMESREIEEAFRHNGYKSGHTYLMRATSTGDREVRPIRYDLTRSGRHLQVLSGPRVIGSQSSPLSLFRN